jgi:PAS domain S-box-containing protein
MNKLLNILVIEDSHADFLMVERNLNQNGLPAHCIRVDTLEGLKEALGGESWDLVLSDYSVPQLNFQDSLNLIRSTHPEMPVILVTGTVGEEKAVDTLKKGAWDFVLKNNLTRLVPAVLGSLNDKKVLEEQRRSVECLKESEERHRIILQTAIDGFWLSDKQGHLMDVNKSYCRMSGYCEQELLSMRTADLVATETTGDVDASIIHMVAQGEGRFESRHRRKDGSIFDVEVSYLYQPINEGRLVFFLRDISKRKQAEELLLESELNYRTLADSGQALIWASRTDKHCDYFNKVWFDFTGRTYEQEFGNGWAEGVHPDDFQHCLDTYVTAFDKREPFSLDYRLRRHDGEYRWIQNDSCPRYDRNGNFVGYIGYCLDITERKLAEEVITNSNRLLNAVINTVPMRVFWKDSESRYLGCNIAFANDAGFVCPDDMIGKDDYQMAWKEQAESYRADDRSVIESGIPKLSFDEQQTTPEGNLVWIRSSKVSHFNESSGQTGILGIYEDITERKQAEMELQKKNAEMEQFIYTVSHDLRSPLVTVKTYIGYLEKDLAEDNQEHLAQDIKFIHSAADKMKLLLDELLEMSRIGRVETLPVKVSLREILNEVLETLAGVTKEHTVDIYLPDTDLMLFGDRPRLCQVWQNLVENAIKYSHDGSIPLIELGIQQESGETVFFVRDNGIGIDPQYGTKIFGIFEKLDPKSPGAGLGLSMVQRIVEKRGGRVWVESDGTGKGSCFKFTLPGALYQE